MTGKPKDPDPIDPIKAVRIAYLKHLSERFQEKKNAEIERCFARAMDLLEGRS